MTSGNQPPCDDLGEVGAEEGQLDGDDEDGTTTSFHVRTFHTRLARSRNSALVSSRVP